MTTSPPDRPEGLSLPRSSGLLAHAAVTLVRLYQMAISPLLGQHCRFEPTCSEYLAQALAKHGAVRGTWLGVCRLLRCHPFSKGGFDPVP